MSNSTKRSILKQIEWAFEAAIFASRWILAPAYVLLILTLAVLTYKTLEEVIQLFNGLHVFDEAHAILQALTIVDMVLVLNLILLVVFVGYINFVSKIQPKRKDDWPNWMTHLGYSGLKVQLLGSIIAIASVRILRTFFEITDADKIDGVRYFWMAIIYCLFLVAVLLIALVNLISKNAHFVGRGEKHVEVDDDA